VRGGSCSEQGVPIRCEAVHPGRGRRLLTELAPGDQDIAFGLWNWASGSPSWAPCGWPSSLRSPLPAGQTAIGEWRDVDLYLDTLRQLLADQPERADVRPHGRVTAHYAVLPGSSKRGSMLTSFPKNRAHVGVFRPTTLADRGYHCRSAASYRRRFGFCPPT
jgi:hypothetical protein